ncbi:hypothetical protein BDF21DRAFT_135500 [Thamnidium elegans]|nr:hypothetical protein BDF21DRAFT_135500 [Thamnidium elegans]
MTCSPKNKNIEFGLVHIRKGEVNKTVFSLYTQKKKKIPPPSFILLLYSSELHSFFFTRLILLSFLLLYFFLSMYSKESNGLHQAFQYLSTLSAHGIFSRKPNSLHEPETHSIITQESVEDYSPFTSRSNSNITISSIDSPTPSIHCLEEPWRLLEDGNIQHDYFFSDRQDLYNNNDQIERFVIK